MAIASVIDNPKPCPKCGCGWKRGTLIERSPVGWTHAHCVTGSAAQESSRPVPPAKPVPARKPKPAQAASQPPAAIPPLPVPKVTVECGMKPQDKALAYIGLGANVLLVGPKGCGKTTMAENIAASLKLPFGFMSLSGGVTETAIFGNGMGDGSFRQTKFVDLYEQGGLFLFDEVDAADANVLLSLNAALANGMLALTKRFAAPIAKRHPHFVCMAAANTHGNGENSQYAGRNVLDGAFVARFRSVTMDYDRQLETKLCPDTELRHLLWKWREACLKANLERTITTRELQWAYKLKTAVNADVPFIIESLSDGWRDEERRKVFG